MSLKQLMKDMTLLPGRISFYYKNLATGENTALNASSPLLAASTIKLFIMGEAFRRAEEGSLSFNELITVPREKCVPSCGALYYMHDGLQVTVGDLVTLMIILSDNTATNLLIDILGIEKINAFIRSLGMEKSTLRRKMFDSEASARGLENEITASELGKFLEMLYRGEVVSPKASEDMISIMKNQRLNGKIPAPFTSVREKVEIAHKTGEDTGITHDVGIVYGPEPFIVCFDGNETDTAALNRLMGDMTYELYLQNGGK